MDTQKRIRIFYILSMIGIVIGFATSAIALVSISASQYGEYNLYMNYIIQLGVLSFGFQDGMLINYRKREYTNMLPTLKRDLNFGFIFQAVVLIFSIILVPIFFKTELGSSQFIILTLSIISFFPVTLLGNIRNAFSALGKFDIIGYFDFLTKIYMLIGIIIVSIFHLNIILFMIIDIIFKFVIVGWLYIKIYHDYNKLNIKEKNTTSNFSIIDNFKKGLFILLGNWSYVLVFSLDKTFLHENTSFLGIYSYSLFVLTTLNQLFIPIKSVIVSMINENKKGKEIFNIATQITMLVFSVVVLYLWIGEPLILYLLGVVGQKIPGIVDKIEAITQGIELSSIITIGMPFYIVVHLLFMSLLLVKDQRKFAFYGIINAIITLFIYFICVNTIKSSPLYAVSIATVINYLITYLFTGTIVIGIKDGFKLIVFSIFLMIISLFLIQFNNIFMFIIITALIIGYFLILKTTKNKEK